MKWILFYFSVFSQLSFAAEAKPSVFEQLIPFVFIFLIFYFLVISPQKKKMKQHGSFLESLKKGDQVLTSSGILGTIEGLTDQYVVLEIADDVKIRILKTQINSFFENPSQSSQ